jgi:MFS family permease
VLAAIGLSAAAGFAQFAAPAALADVAAAFGETAPGETVAAQIGLSGTALGVGLATMRLASLTSLPLSAQADRLGRRRIITAATAVGLILTAASALSPSYWVFVAIFALGRPLLSVTNAVAGVIAAEETPTSQRALALALITAGYGAGAGVTSAARSIGGEALGFRGLFALTLVPILLLPLAARALREPDRFTLLQRARQASQNRPPVLGRLAGGLRGRMWLLGLGAFALALVTVPANSLLFVYGEGLLGLTPTATAALVVSAGVPGIVGLFAGRWAADRLGRRLTAGLSLAAAAAAVAVMYAGGVPALVVGYLTAILAAAIFAPPMGALAAEAFPTRVRGTVAGWLTVASVFGSVTGLLGFGALSDALGGFGGAAAILAVPAAAAAACFRPLPEPWGLELEETAPA